MFGKKTRRGAFFRPDLVKVDKKYWTRRFCVDVLFCLSILFGRGGLVIYDEKNTRGGGVPGVDNQDTPPTHASKNKPPNHTNTLFQKNTCNFHKFGSYLY